MGIFEHNFKEVKMIISISHIYIFFSSIKFNYVLSSQSNKCEVGNLMNQSALKAKVRKFSHAAYLIVNFWRPSAYLMKGISRQE